MAELFIPTLHTFAMNNIFTGSQGLFRFRAVPNVVMLDAKEVDFEKSTMEGDNTFPMTEEGRSAMKQGLESNI